MSRRKRNKSRSPANPAPATPVQRSSAPPATDVARSKHAWIAGAAPVVLCAVVGYFAANLFTEPAAAGRKAPIVVEGDGVRGPKGMVWVAGGEFLMGSDHKLAQPNERPAHKVRVGGFWMDQTHVTNVQFAEFVKATGYVTTAERKPDWEALKVQVPPGTPKPPDSALVPGAMVFTGTYEPVLLNDYSRWWAYVPGANWRHPQGPASRIEGKDDHPVVQVSYEDALAYAKWAGKRLPTEAEWEKAARGTDDRRFPWGNVEPTAKHLNFNQQWIGEKTLMPVGSYELGKSPYGAYDMAGNVWEWVADWYDPAYYEKSPAKNPSGPETGTDKVLRSSGWAVETPLVRIFTRVKSDPLIRNESTGFRCAMSAPRPQ